MKIAVIGSGGHSKVIQEMIMSMTGNEIIGIFDDKFQKEFKEQNVQYGPVFSAKRMAEKDDQVKFILAIGNNEVRNKIVNLLMLPIEKYATIIHPSAVISKTAKIRNGSVIMPNAVINAEAVVGSHCIINTSSVIEHNCMLRDFVHISPKAVLTGGVEVEDGVQLGAGSTVIPNIKIGSWSMIGAGAVVIRDIPSNSIAVGVPAKVLNKSKGGKAIVDCYRKTANLSFATSHERP
ncbi:acetyltransferase [Falsibacillus pallidus]|uniref:Acetyltransferase EpsM n=1 Tax=Falsibacillus pallidus TaxID=493781 RepID=A0A370GUV6_9BACI|nr:acetyltransferase [Falsibacillus pallidus]RDI45713.1 acetyltransferase EpsM [Falsibacillus pallidus]